MAINNSSINIESGDIKISDFIVKSVVEKNFILYTIG